MPIQVFSEEADTASLRGILVGGLVFGTLMECIIFSAAEHTRVLKCIVSDMNLTYANQSCVSDVSLFKRLTHYQQRHLRYNIYFVIL